MNHWRQVIPGGAALLTLVVTGGLAGCGGSSGTDNSAASDSTGSDTTAKNTASGTTGSTGSPGGGASLRIAVIPKGTTHEYWKSIHAGALKAQKELAGHGQNVEIIWKGTEKEDDRNSQVDLVDNFVTQKVSGMVLAPLDEHALAQPIETASSKGIPVVVIDSGVDTDKYASFVATDNEKGGHLAGDRLAELLNKKGRVIMLRYEVNSASTELREKGFMDAISKYPGIKVVSQDQHAGSSPATAQEASENLLNRFKGGVDGIFTPNESSTVGMRQALIQAGLINKVKFVGFDASAILLDALQKKELQGLVVQNPFNMGYLGVMTDVDAINKKKVEKRIDTGVTLVTPENMNSPDNQELLHPPLSK
ncbi:MAG: substrate-binding domain-containing protein, partial [Armatimonadota bacterium]|nr:substrate-binding domain-containing protein [Armatimonadota bacterium]